MKSSGGSKNADDDELYEGFNYNVEIGGAPPGTAAGQPNPFEAASAKGDLRVAPGTGRRVGTGRLYTAGGSALPPGSDARPMTSIKGAGYQSENKNSSFDPLNQAGKGPAPPLATVSDNGPEAKAREMEKGVNQLVEEAADALAIGDHSLALKKSKDAMKKERQLSKLRESSGFIDQINLELTYSVCFTLATAYESSGMYQEALNSYSLIVRNKQYPHAGRLRVNMGNIYFAQKKYVQAIKMYQMAQDQIPNTEKEIRHRIQRNIGNAYIKSGEFQDAVQCFESIMHDSPDFQTGFNLIVCSYALGDVDHMKKSFQLLLSVPSDASANEDDEDELESKSYVADPGTLLSEIDIRKKKSLEYITNAAKLIAPILNKEDWTVGFDWIIECLCHDYPKISSEMIIAKSMCYLKKKEFKKAIQVLKGFEKKEKEFMARAATNLSFLYYLEGDIAQADNYGNLAVQHDRYNAKALVNKGNCLYIAGELEKAKELYLESIGVDASCVEAIFNLGLVNKRLGIYKDSLQAFEKLHSLLPSSPAVLYQIANLHDIMGNYRQSTKWFNILITRVPTDPGVLSRLGQIFNKDDNETQAFHFHLEAYRYYPVDLDVISWLGVWYVKSEFYERAIEFFQRAAEIQPGEVKWQLMVTSCYRRMGNYQRALELYEDIYKEYPENLECLRYLVAICKDLGMKYDHYQRALSGLERRSAQEREIDELDSPMNHDNHNLYNVAESPLGNEGRDEMNGIRRKNPTSPMGGSTEGMAGSLRDSGNLDESGAMDWGDADLDDLLAE